MAWYRLLTHAWPFLLYFREIASLCSVSTWNNIWTKYSKVVHIRRATTKQRALRLINLAIISDTNGETNKTMA